MRCFVKFFMLLFSLFSLTFSSLAVDNLNYSVSDLEVYYDNEVLPHVIPIYYNDKLYLPLFLRSSSWNKDNNCLEIYNLPTNDKLETAYIWELDKVNPEVKKDMKVTYNGTILDLKGENGRKLYPILYNGLVYLPDSVFKEILLLNLEISDDGYRLDINENDSLQQVVEEFLRTVYSDNLVPNEVVTLTNQLENHDEYELFCKFISDIYFYGDKAFSVEEKALKSGKYVVSFIPDGIRKRIDDNLGFTDYLFSLSDDIGITNDMNELNKIKLLNKWILSNYSYGVSSSNIFKDLLREEIGDSSSYAYLFYHLGKFNGLDVEIVYDIAKLDNKLVPHVWNKVFIDGSWYHVDIYCNDSGKNSLEKYLLLSEGEMTYNHRMR